MKQSQMNNPLFSRFSGKGGMVSGLFLAAAVVAFAVFVWFWGFCRVYVPSGRMAIVTAKSGEEPKPGTILVERGQKGIWREVLGEGRYFFNPIEYEVTIVPAVNIPLGKVGIVTSKIGRELAPGEIIAPDSQSKGVLREVLGPGLYRLNPQGYTIEVADAISIPVGYVGVVTSQTGKAPKPGEFAAAGEKGVLRDILQPGLYYINPYAYQVNVIEIGMNQVTMSGSGRTSVVSTRNRLFNANDAVKDLESNTLNTQQLQRQKKAMLSKSKLSVDGGARREAAAAALGAQIFGVSRAVEFPSRDGFKVSLDMTVEFELMPDSISKIYLLYGDLPQVVEKIILPQVLSTSRLKGSSYRAQDFIMGEGRETFQNDLRSELEKTLKTKNIIVHNAIIRNVDIPMDILSPIRAVSVAKEQNLTNVSLQDTAKRLAELNTELALIEQRRKQVEQETRKMVAEIQSRQAQSVAEIEAATKLEVANINLKRSEILAKISRLKGETGVKTRFLVESASADGEQMRSEVLGGTGRLADLQLIESLNPEVETRVIYAGSGTLWTDLKGGALALPAKK